ncbi:MAG: serine hydrolase [Syntrophothermus sp.]
MKKIFYFLLTMLSTITFAQKLPDDYTIDQELSNELKKIVTDLGLDKQFDVGEDGIETISFAVIDLMHSKPMFGGVNADNFIYPASVYKMYVAAEILHQVSEGKLELTTPYVVPQHNAVDVKSEMLHDPRPLIKGGDTVNVNYLLDLMITRSDNSSANCLIDIADRKNINAMIKHFGWEGSEVTRKFLKRKFEDPSYDTIRGTETSALHSADFMYRIETNTLYNPWVSMQMKALLGRQLDRTKIASGLPKNVMYYNKTGWFAYWTNDVGIVDDGKVKYIIACFMPLEEELAHPKFKELSSKVYELMEKRSK